VARRGKDTVWKVGLYIRLSRDDGNDESLSVTNQRKILLEYLEKDFGEPHELVDLYIDDGRTGTDYDRPEFQRLLHDVETGRVSCVICKNLSRAFRNYADQGYFLETFFPLHGTRFITLGEPKIDTFRHPEAISGLEVPISGLMNDRFAAQTSSSVRRTLDLKRRKGEFIGAFAPYGYKKDPRNKNALVADEEAARVVRDIFRWYVYGEEAGAPMSKEGIAKRLNELGVPSPALYKARQGLKYKNPRSGGGDGLWSASSVSRILSNKVYIGTMVQGRQRVISYKVHDQVSVPEEEWYEVENTHEAIVPRELFEKAQSLRKRERHCAPGKRNVHLFSGLLFCADCGRAMTRRRAGGYVYYNCSTYRRKSKTKCTRHTLRQDRLEAAVLEALNSLLGLVDEEIFQRVEKAPAGKDTSSRLRNLLYHRQRELSRIEDFLFELYMDWKSGDIDRDQYRALRERAEGEKARIAEAIERLKREIDALQKEEGFEDPEMERILRSRTFPRLTQGLLQELVEGIYVHEGGEVTLHLKVRDPFGESKQKNSAAYEK